MGQNVDENEEYELNSTIPPNIKQSPAKPQHKFLKRNTIEDNRDNNKLQSKPDLDNPSLFSFFIFLNKISKF